MCSLPEGLPCTGLSQASQGPRIPKNWSYQQRIKQKRTEYLSLFHIFCHQLPHPIQQPFTSSLFLGWTALEHGGDDLWISTSSSGLQGSLPWDSSKQNLGEVQNVGEAQLYSSEVYGWSCDIYLVPPSQDHGLHHPMNTAAKSALDLYTPDLFFLVSKLQVQYLFISCLIIFIRSCCQCTQETSWIACVPLYCPSSRHLNVYTFPLQILAISSDCYALRPCLKNSPPSN